MLLRDLKRVANKCCFNPNKCSTNQRVTLDVGNPQYWATKAMECIVLAKDCSLRSVKGRDYLQQATELLILAQAYDADEKAKKTKKARDNTTKQHNKDVKGT